MDDYVEPPLTKDQIDALQSGNLRRVRRLIDRSNVNAVTLNSTITTHGWRPLHYAVSTGNYEVCEYLIGELAYTNADTNFGNLPLKLALRIDDCKNRDRLCALLLDSGADPTKKANIPLQRSPLEVAVYEEQVSTCQLFLNHMVELSVSHIPEEASIVIPEEALILAVAGSAPIFSMLLKHMTSIDDLDVLFHAMTMAISLNNVQFAKMLLDKERELRANGGKEDKTIEFLSRVNKESESLLHVAALHACIDSCRFLLERKIGRPVLDVNYKNQIGQTPLHFVISNNYVEPGHEKRRPNVCRLFAEYGADPTIPDKYGVTPLSRISGDRSDLEFLRPVNTKTCSITTNRCP